MTDIVHCNAVSPGYFANLGAPLLSGRDFNERDAHDDPNLGYRSAIVNESLAKRYFGDRNPIDARIGLGDGPDTKAVVKIVGVVKTFAYRGIRVTEDQVFFPVLEGLPGSGAFYVRTRAQSQAAFASIRSVVPQIARPGSAYRGRPARSVAVERADAGDAGEHLRRAGDSPNHRRALWRDCFHHHAAYAGDRHSSRAGSVEKLGRLADPARQRH